MENRLDGIAAALEALAADKARHAAERLGVNRSQLVISEGVFSAGDGKQLTLAELATDEQLRAKRGAANAPYPGGAPLEQHATCSVRLPGEDRGVVFQGDDSLFTWCSALQNVEFGPRLRGLSKGERESHARKYIELVGLGGQEEKFPAELSGGMKQRIQIARCLANEPKMLLMDEPFGALDPLTREVLQAELKRVHQQTGKTIVFVTHDMDEALQLATRIALLNGGRLVQYDRPIEMMVKPADDFVREFIGQADLGLKLLSRRWVHQYQRAPSLEHHATLPGLDHCWQLDDAGRPVALEGARLDDDHGVTPVKAEWTATPEMSMKEALSRMVWYRVMVLPVVDDAGKLIGEIGMQGVMGIQAEAEGRVS